MVFKQLSSSCYERGINNSRCRYGIVVFLLMMSLSALAADIEVDLGDRKRVARLFSFPNCEQNCQKPAPSLPQTVSRWLTRSVRADAKDHSIPSVHVREESNRIIAHLNGVENDYGDVLRSFLDTGDIAFSIVKELNSSGLWGGNWRFMLPLGLAMYSHWTVELLHFPPDTALEDEQNYLTAATTKRWATLLNLNGADPRDNERFQAVIDVLPVAAPASAGKQLDGVLDNFSPYIKALLYEWTEPAPGSTTTRPVVALGGPARGWLSRHYGLGNFSVLDLAKIDFGGGRPISVLGGNHPSAIWYASSDRIGIAMMREDLIVSCWQSVMVQLPEVNPAKHLDDCKLSWRSSTDVCLLYHTTVKSTSITVARKLCETLSED